MRTLPGLDFMVGLASDMSYHQRYRRYVAGMDWRLLVVAGDGAFGVPFSSAAPADRLATLVDCITAVADAVCEWTSLLPWMTAQIVPPS